MIPIYCTFCGHETEVVQFDQTLVGWTDSNEVSYHLDENITREQLDLLVHPSNRSKCHDSPVALTPNTMSLKTYFHLKADIQSLRDGKSILPQDEADKMADEFEIRLKKFENGKVVFA